MQHTTLFSRGVLAVVMSSLLLAACGGATQPAATQPATAPAAAAATNAPQAATAAIDATVAAPASAPAVTEPTAAPPTTAPTDAPVTAPASLTALKLNLNTVTAEQLLAAIPNFGNRMVREFQEYRPYISIQQFRREIGKYVDQAQVAEYEKYVYVPIDMNSADAATLQQIPGLDATEADQLVARRPFAASDAFLAELAQYISADEVAVAQGYLSQP